MDVDRPTVPGVAALAWTSVGDGTVGSTTVELEQATRPAINRNSPDEINFFMYRKGLEEFDTLLNFPLNYQSR